MSTNHISVARFRLGKIASTPSALEDLSPEDILLGIQRHQSGDWGDVAEEDCQANDHALEDGSRLFSKYQSATGVKFWIVTEADRSSTMVLLPQDY